MIIKIISSIIQYFRKDEHQITLTEEDLNAIGDAISELDDI